MLAGQWVGARKCGKLGLMGLEVASFGAQYIEGLLTQYTVDPSSMSIAVSAADTAYTVDAAWCNAASMQILAKMREAKQRGAVVSAEQKVWTDLANSQPKRTICNRVGTQTFCSTY